VPFRVYGALSTLRMAFKIWSPTAGEPNKLRILDIAHTSFLCSLSVRTRVLETSPLGFDLVFFNAFHIFVLNE